MRRHLFTFLMIATIITVFVLTGMVAGTVSIAKVLFYMFFVMVTLSLVLGPILIRKR